MLDVVVSPLLEYGFMRRALAGCLALSFGAPVVGVFLMLRRMSLTGDAIAHAILPGAAVGFLVAGLSLGALAIGGLIAGLAVVLLAGFVSRSTVIREDASLAAFYLISLGVGVLLVSLRGSNIDLLHVLFGSVLALDDAALKLVASVTMVTLLLVALLFRPLVMECVDRVYLRSVSRTSSPAHYLFLVLVVLNLVAGFQALGTLLAVGMMILPAAAARFWAADIANMICAAVVIAALGSVAGLLLSFHGALATGPSIISVMGGIYVLSLLAGPVGSLRAVHFPRRHLEA